MDNWKNIYTTDHQHKAEAMQKLLSDENIEAVVINKKDSSYQFFLGDVELYVRKEDENLAIELIKGFNLE